MTELQAALGSTLPAGTAQLTLFVPGTNRSGEPIDQTYWVGQALACLGRLFRGATAFPPAEGVWRDDSAGGELLFESTRMVLSYADPDLLDESEVLGELRRFLHRMGAEAQQGEVGIVIDGSYFGITDYDREEGAT